MRAVIFLMCAVALAACSKPTPPEDPAPAPTPVMTPHPAAGAKEAAVQKFPDLAVKDSTFNKTFRDIYASELEKNPISLTRPEWPLDLAFRTAGLLGVQPRSPSRVTPTPLPVPMNSGKPVVLATPTPSMLDRGAYNKTDRSGHYWVDQYGKRRYYYVP